MKNETWFQQGEGEGGLFAGICGKDAIMGSLKYFNNTVHVALSSTRMRPDLIEMGLCAVGQKCSVRWEHANWDIGIKLMRSQ